MSSIEAAEAHHGVGIKPYITGALAGAVAGVALYRQLNPRIDPELYQHSLLPYCEDIADAVMREHEAVIVGGLPIDAFNAPDSIIDATAEQPSITVSEKFFSPLIRKKNGTVRDYDIIVLDSEPHGKLTRLPDEEQVTLKKRLLETAGERAKRNNEPVPEMSIASFDDHTSLFHSATMVENGRVFMRQGFVSQELPEASLSPWNLVFPDGTTVKILNPWEQYWRSLVRYPSGMKPKDTEKLALMHDKLLHTEGLAELADSPLSKAYGAFHDAMLAGNSFAALKTELVSRSRNWRRAAQLGLLAIARTVMATGQKSDTIERIVQATPKVFNLFVGSK